MTNPSIDPHRSLHRRGGYAIAAGAGLWGLFWYPLRLLDQNGIPGLWAVTLVLGATAIVSLFPLLHFRPRLDGNRRAFCTIGLGIGISTVFYFAGMILSDVVRVIFLFYLLPIWSMLSARLLYGVSISRSQMAVVVLALGGLFLLLGGDGNLPVPRAMGDWFGLLAGFFWGLSLTLLRGAPDIDPVAATTAPFLFGAPIALAFAVFFHLSGIDRSTVENSLNLNPANLSIAFALGAFLLWPSMFGQVWGARMVPSTTAALLTMSEILVATVSAWLIVGTNLTTAGFMGGAIIVVAAVWGLIISDG